MCPVYAQRIEQAQDPVQREIDDLGMHAGADGIQDISACEVDGRGAVEIKIKTRAMRGNDCMNGAHHVPPGQVVGLQA